MHTISELRIPLFFSMKKYLLLITAILTIVVTSLLSIPGSPYLIWGMTQADISNKFSTSVTPSGLTFGIWSLIYLSWIVVGVYIAFFQKWKKKIDDTSIITFSLAIGLTVLWLFPWGNIWIGTALLVMLVILWLLAYSFSLTREAHVYVRSSVEITLGWIIMATALNITVWLRYLGFPIGAPGDLYYAIFALGAILIIISELQCRYKTYIISWVFLWTLSGVWFAHTLFEQRVAVTIYTIVICIYIWNSLHGKSTSLKSLKFW